MRVLTLLGSAWLDALSSGLPVQWTHNLTMVLAKLDRSYARRLPWADGGHDDPTDVGTRLRRLDGYTICRTREARSSLSSPWPTVFHLDIAPTDEIAELQNGALHARVCACQWFATLRADLVPRVLELRHPAPGTLFGLLCGFRSTYFMFPPSFSPIVCHYLTDVSN